MGDVSAVLWSTAKSPCTFGQRNRPRYVWSSSRSQKLFLCGNVQISKEEALSHYISYKYEQYSTNITWYYAFYARSPTGTNIVWSGCWHVCGRVANILGRIRYMSPWKSREINLYWIFHQKRWLCRFSRSRHASHPTSWWRWLWPRLINVPTEVDFSVKLFLMFLSPIQYVLRLSSSGMLPLQSG